MSRFLYINSRELDMTQIQKALLWAAAMIGIALAVAGGLIAEETAAPFFFSIPALYVATSGRAACCNPFRRKLA